MSASTTYDEHLGMCGLIKTLTKSALPPTTALKISKSGSPLYSVAYDIGLGGGAFPSSTLNGGSQPTDAGERGSTVEEPS